MVDCRVVCKIQLDYADLGYKVVPVPVAAQFMAWVCGRWFAGVAGSNPAAVMAVCLL